MPDEVEFATKPAPAAAMLTRAVDTATPAHGVTGDEVYGVDPQLRARLEDLGLGYVLAIGCDRRVATHGGLMRPDRVAAALPAHCWTRYSAGAGAKGPRIYDWAFVKLADTADAQQAPGNRWLLIRRHPGHGELAFYRCYSPQSVPLRELVRVAGARWRIEESFQASKTLTGLDEHQVRRWSSWRRWTLVAMLAHALLAVLAATASPAPAAGLIPLTCNEIARLINRLLLDPLRRLADTVNWMNWQRRHQHRALASHYRRRPQT